jgi:hypothetical protein
MHVKILIPNPEVRIRVAGILSRHNFKLKCLLYQFIIRYYLSFYFLRLGNLGVF